MGWVPVFGGRDGAGLVTQIPLPSGGDAESEVHGPKPDLIPNPQQLLMREYLAGFCVVRWWWKLHAWCTLVHKGAQRGSAVVRGGETNCGNIYGPACACLHLTGVFLLQIGSCKASVQVTRGSQGSEEALLCGCREMMTCLAQFQPLKPTARVGSVLPSLSQSKHPQSPS